MGYTLVFLHGFLESTKMWDCFANVFEKDHQIACVDLPGHGETPVLGEIHSMELMADYVVDQLKERDIQSAIFIGHSMGGYVGLEIGKKYPNMVEGLTLFFSTAAPDAPQKKIDRERAARVVEKNSNIFIREAVPFLFTEQHKIKFEKEIEEQTQLALQTKPEGIIACLKGMRDRVSNVEYLNDAPYPIQFILGQDDPVINIDTLDVQLSAKAVKDVEIIEKCGHMGHIEAKAQCQEALRRFIAKLA